MSDPEEAPRSGTAPWRRPALVAAALAVSLAIYVSLRPEAPAPQAAAPAKNFADAAVVSEFSGVATVSDGDSFRLGERRVRLDGIIAPERSVQCGDVNVHRAAGDALREITRSERVVCRISDVPDAEGRDMALCRAGDVDLNAHMVANGWARDWPRHSGGAYAEEEAAARAAQLGIWSASCPANLWSGSQFEE